MGGRARVVAIVFAAVFVAFGARADAGEFSDSNTAFERGEFETARAGYEHLIERGVVNERVYYNLGNSYYRIGEFGLAIYNYERALSVEPSFADAKYNLNVARDAVTARVGDRLEAAEVRGPMWRLVYHFTLGELAVALLVLNALFFALLLVLRFMGEGLRRTALWVVTVFVGLTLAVCVGLTCTQIYAIETKTEGVVLADEIVLREGASDDRAERGQLHAGLRVEVVSTRLSWSRVRLRSGVEGWVPSRHIGILEVGE